MTVLVTAGTGKTSQRLVPYLDKAEVSYILTSRSAKASSASSPRYVQFDFTNPSTFVNAFPSDVKDKINAVWLIAPIEEVNAAEITIEFINYAVKEHSVKRFVMLTGTSATKGGPSVGQVWQRLAELEVEFTVLRATWFTGKVPHQSLRLAYQKHNWSGVVENFTEWYHHKTIKEESNIYSAAEDGRARYVTADDIARTAFHALTVSICPSFLLLFSWFNQIQDTVPLPENVQVLGPELLSLDQVAQIFTEVLGRPVKHIRLAEDERVKFFQEKSGLIASTAAFMTWLEVRTASGGEEHTSDTVEKYTGIKPKGLREWVEEHKKVFE